jgi:hypothetical protein
MLKYKKHRKVLFVMNTTIQTYNDILTKSQPRPKGYGRGLNATESQFFFKQFNLKIGKSTGRKLANTEEDTIALSIFKQAQGIITKKAIWKIFSLKCSYKTLVVNMNRLAIQALLITQAILK